MIFFPVKLPDGWRLCAFLCSMLFLMMALSVAYVFK